MNEEARQGHIKSKVHKRRLKQISEGGWDPKDAERAAVSPLSVICFPAKLTVSRLKYRVEGQTMLRSQRLGLQPARSWRSEAVVQRIVHIAIQGSA